MFSRKKKTEQDNNSREGPHDEQHNKKHNKSRFYRRFAQQELAGWSPIITGNVVVIYFFIIGVVCIALGVPILLAALGVTEYKVRYDDTGAMAGLTTEDSENILLQQNGEGVTTIVNVTITKDMRPPVRCPSY